jgi:lysyl-tRNA synthetase class 2
MPWEPNKLERERLDKLKRIQDRGINPYPPRVQRTHTTAEAIAAYEAIAPVGTDQATSDLKVTVCGRIRSMRVTGKLTFAHIEDGTGKVQLFIRQDAIGEDTYGMLRHDFDLFDFVQATGVMMRTKTGEVSVNVSELVLLSKALSPLPVVKEQEVDGQTVTYGGFTDTEERYRQRYADLATNPEVREVFRARAKIVSAIRNFLDNEEDFLEVETPILQPIYGGAAARPFVTHHNQLKQDLFLRISFELYLKRLLVGMYDSVYEIGRDFRNEGVSFKHNPEFTQLEFYKAYIDYNGVMDIVERMLAAVAQKTHGSTTVKFKGVDINFAPPYKRWKLRDAIREMSGIDYVDHPNGESLAKAMQAIGMAADPKESWGKLVDDLLSKFVEPTLIQPTFLIDYPRDISPFAKAFPDDPTQTERFEIYAGGMELGNAFTELNDPIDQEQRFIEMGRLYADEADEATPLDEDYLRAMRYGMPPCGGFGMGIDRVTMMMMDRDTIREVVLFPHLRDKDKSADDEPTVAS